MVVLARRQDLTQHQFRRVPLPWRRKHAPAPIDYRNAKRTAPPARFMPGKRQH